MREGKAVLVNLDISVPDKEQAEIMCNHWKDRSQEIYAYVMKSLMSEHGVEKNKDDKEIAYETKKRVLRVIAKSHGRTLFFCLISSKKQGLRLAFYAFCKPLSFLSIYITFSRSITTP